jgi:hypothetical protein
MNANELKGSKSFRELNPQVFGLPGVSKVTQAYRAPAEKKRIRQSSKGLNRTEQEFHDYINNDEDDLDPIHTQSVTLLLANGVRYTPDFIAISGCNGELSVRAYEVKGYMRDDAAVKIKVAARLYNWITFYIATKRAKKNGGGWSIEVVLP